MENPTHIELLREIRSAHRLINEYQSRIQEMILSYIAPKLTFDGVEGMNTELAARHLFCDPVQKMSCMELGEKAFRITKENWAWDLLYTHAIEYFLGTKDDKTYPKKVYGFSIIQISDTGAYLPVNPEKGMKSSSNFRNVDECDTLFIFKIKYAGKNARKGWMHTNDRNTDRLKQIILNEDDLFRPADSPNTCYYRVSLKDLMDEASCEKVVAKVNAVFDESGNPLWKT